MDVLHKNINLLIKMSNEIKNFEDTEDFLNLWPTVIDDISLYSYPRPFQNEVWSIICKMSHNNQITFVKKYRLKILENIN